MMRKRAMKGKWMLLGSIVAVSVSFGLYFAIAVDDISSQTILDTDKTIIDQDIQYPTGSPHITSKIITIPVGSETGPHIHEIPMYAYILKGEVTVDYGEKGTKTFVEGDSMIEAINYTHNGKNNGKEPTEILVVLIDES